MNWRRRCCVSPACLSEAKNTFSPLSGEQFNEQYGFTFIISLVQLFCKELRVCFLSYQGFAELLQTLPGLSSPEQSFSVCLIELQSLEGTEKKQL